MLGNQYAKGHKPTNPFTRHQLAGGSNHRAVACVVLVCEHCNDPFAVKPHATKGRRFCSRRCFTQSGVFVGDKSPCYVGGPDSRRGRSWRRVRLVVIARQNGRCADCPRHMGVSLPVHHKIPWRDFTSEDEANHPDNLVGLCPRCHARRENTQAADNTA